MKKLFLLFTLMIASGGFFLETALALPNTPPPGTVSGVTSSPRPQARPTSRPTETTAAETTTTGTTTTGTSSAASASTEVGSSGGIGIYEVTLQEPLDGNKKTLRALNGVDLINQYISMIYMWMASIIGLVAVLMIVVSGVQIIFGGASPELVTDAKTRIVQSLLSLILLFSTALILKTVNPGFFAYV